MNPISPATNKFNNKKVFDIVRPGKPMASPSSRPLIITNKPQVVDKQVTPASFGGAGVSVPAAPTAPARIRTAVQPPTAPRLQGGATQRPLMRHNTVPPMGATAPAASSTAVTPQPEPAAAAPVTAPTTAPMLPKKTAIKIAKSTPEKPAKSHAVKVTHKDDKQGEGTVAVGVEKHAPAPKVSADPLPMPATPPTEKPAAPQPQSAPPLTPIKMTAPPTTDSLLEPLSDEEMEAIRSLSADEPKPAGPLLAVKKPTPQPEEIKPHIMDPLLDIDESEESGQGTSEAKAPAEPEMPAKQAEPAAPDVRETVGIPTKDPDLKHEDIMAGAGMVMPKHEDTQLRPVTVHHRRKLSWWQWTLILLLTIIIGLVAFNFLIDAELLKVNMDIPTTNLL